MRDQASESKKLDLLNSKLDHYYSSMASNYTIRGYKRKWLSGSLVTDNGSSVTTEPSSYQDKYLENWTLVMLLLIGN